MSKGKKLLAAIAIGTVAPIALFYSWTALYLLMDHAVEPAVQLVTNADDREGFKHRNVKEIEVEIQKVSTSNFKRFEPEDPDERLKESLDGIRASE